MSALIINKENFQQEVIQSDKPVLLDFWAPWCGPCRMVLPLVEEIAGERDDIKVGKVNVDEQAELAAQFGVMTAPLAPSPKTRSWQCCKVKRAYRGRLVFSCKVGKTVVYY